MRRLLMRPRARVHALALLLAITSAWTVGVPAAAAAVSPDLVIGQVYGAGGNSGATFNRDLVELFNGGSARSR